MLLESLSAVSPWCHASQLSIRRCMLGALALGLCSLLLSVYVINHNSFRGFLRSPVPPRPTFQCRSQLDDSGPREQSAANVHASSAQLRLDPRVLVFVETQFSKLGKQICEILEGSRFRFKVETTGKTLPVLTNLDKGKFAVIVFENFEKYLAMHKWNRELIDKYCREYSVGIIGFIRPREDTYTGAQLSGLPLYMHTNMALKDYRLNPLSSILRIARAGETFSGNLPGEDWTVFQPNHSTFVPLAQARSQHDDIADGNGPHTTVVQDIGRFDGIQRVIFGNGFGFWLHKLLFLDSISFLSHGKLSLPLQRYLLIDIDDIFVAERGSRMMTHDVQALLDAQQQFRKLIHGFRFNLGFSGKFYHRGSHEENKGDDMLLSHAHEFWWFCHMWSHSQPHLYDNVTLLETEMRLNREFAKKHRIQTDSGYSVAPHHSGVYPVHEPLYDAWKKVWNIRVTSTEEYPHLRPARLRRGFVHRNIMVLPRQTCGLYTHTIFLERYPGGREKLDRSIHGGDLFYLFVYNPINIFMTHLSNYGNDRLSLYTFETVLKFIKCWTNLKLSTIPPLQLAEKYFQMYPDETDPIWMNPCEDKRHLSIWSSSKSCEQLPKFLVIGPQKTGTTALYTFLTLHPTIASNHPSPDTFEEVQFFNGKNYYRGLDWYQSFFPAPKNGSAPFLFEKSANYFDGELVPQRAHALLPRAKLVTILISPTKRAYSWYQHQRSHGDTVALNFTFYDVITANDHSPKPLRELRNRCLNPGLYAQHLERWLSFYPPQQLMIIDGEELKSDPVRVMNKLQTFLAITPFFDYSGSLRFDPHKGFFCKVLSQNNRTKCLGQGKGRLYPAMDIRAEKFLKAYYLSHNVALSKLFNNLRQPQPHWLKEDLSRG
ncbi:bifunctional heparan sulfate N-deacetylase/N-sulfotransferase isoform X1 [Dermacentor andersoni]|uniref:bifunctional heparan sulfate N-deacetylase/N-sulfotransferase isoform X1 n=1 Tax=Dermacentor andersoni TaxID=34620 RepID=UPI002155AC4C|nr:bifunctional heparan sulfate N-deacetylase/N-sulfotransferase-like isoform X1 [Dermacentor andersoni]XP_054919539.1 bifunctional heparan sulfate N-deacetylase/N-sulfotransferase-like isoform X1 [Dermacentor andersoni]